MNSQNIHKNHMEFHQLELRKHCRVCGKRLCKAKSKATVDPCSKHPNLLLKCFGIDVSQDDPTVHPLSFCNPCYAVTRRWTKVAADGVHYSNSVQSMEWSSHVGSECGVSTAGLKIIE